MKAPYSPQDIYRLKSFTERKIRTEANVQALMLGPIQARKYFESIAILSQERDNMAALRIIEKYHKTGRVCMDSLKSQVVKIISKTLMVGPLSEIQKRIDLAADEIVKLVKIELTKGGLTHETYAGSLAQPK
jgi:hypothetical protein